MSENVLKNSFCKKFRAKIKQNNLLDIEIGFVQEDIEKKKTGQKLKKELGKTGRAMESKTGDL